MQIEVSIRNNQPVTTSLEIARVFSKQHKDVLRAIKNLEIPDDFNQRNFAPVKYTDNKGEKRPMFYLTRDGFTILVMGFTGEKAMRFKIAYIEAFNRMEEELRNSSHISHPSSPLLPAVEDAIGIANAFGFTGNQGLLSANNMLRSTLGMDFLELLGRKALVCENQECHLTPTEIGRLLGGISAQKVNKFLEKAGVIVSYEDTKKRKKWKPTDKGKSYVIMKDTGKRHSDGTPVQQMFFLESVIGLIPDIERTLYREPIPGTDEEIRLTDTITRAHQAGADPPEVIGKACASASL